MSHTYPFESGVDHGRQPIYLIYLFILLFLIFINDLPNHIKLEIKLFVDYVKLLVRRLSKETI